MKRTMQLERDGIASGTETLILTYGSRDDGWIRLAAEIEDGEDGEVGGWK
jgi:hypothetical protein